MLQGHCHLIQSRGYGCAPSFRSQNYKNNLLITNFGNHFKTASQKYIRGSVAEKPFPVVSKSEGKIFQPSL